MQILDATDRSLVRQLQDDAAISVTELSTRTGLTHGACWRRVERLERDGIIRARRVVLDPKALGYEVQVFLRVTLDKTQPNAFDEFIAAARDIPHVLTIETLLGRVDVRMDVIARDLAHYQDIYQHRILELPHIADIEALMLVSELKNTEALAI